MTTRRPSAVATAAIVGGAIAVSLCGIATAWLMPPPSALVSAGDGQNPGAEEDEKPLPFPAPTFRAPQPTVTEISGEEPVEEEGPKDKAPAQSPTSRPSQPPRPVIHYFRALAGTTPVDCTGAENGGVGGDLEWSASNALDGSGVLLKGAGSNPHSLPVYTSDLSATGSSGVYVDCIPGNAATTYTLLVVDLYGREATATFTFERSYR